MIDHWSDMGVFKFMTVGEPNGYYIYIRQGASRGFPDGMQRKILNCQAAVEPEEPVSDGFGIEPIRSILTHFTTTSTALVVSLPRMSMTFTSTVYVPGSS